MPLWFCEFRTTVSGKIEAASAQEAQRKFTEALDALDLGAGDIQDFRLERSRSGYATEVEAIQERKPAKGKRQGR